MAGRVREIRVLGDPVLRMPCAPVSVFDADLAGLVDDLVATMRAANGVGLAANQIGVSTRVFVYACPDVRGKRRKGHVVNPVLVAPVRAPSMVDDVPEGCLSVPGQHARLKRPDRAVVRGVDVRGRPVEVDATGPLARCVHHELDHLEGLLYLDRLGRWARGKVLRRYRSSA